MSTRLATLHAALLATIVVVFGVLALWGLMAGALGRGPGRVYTSGLVIGQLLVVAEALLGTVLLLGGLRPARPELHVMYALVAVAVLPVAHRYVQDRAPRQQLLCYALACLFLCAIALRGAETGRAPLEQPAPSGQHPPKGGAMRA